MAKDIFGSKYPIKNKTALYSMLTIGVLLIFFGLFTEQIRVFFGSDVITPYLMFVFGVVVVLITWTELGLKRYTDFSRLNKFSNQQMVTFVVSVMVLLSTGLSAFMTVPFSFLGWFNSGVFVASGAVIILEALR